MNRFSCAVLVLAIISVLESRSPVWVGFPSLRRRTTTISLAVLPDRCFSSAAFAGVGEVFESIKDRAKEYYALGLGRFLHMACLMAMPLKGCFQSRRPNRGAAVFIIFLRSWNTHPDVLNHRHLGRPRSVR